MAEKKRRGIQSQMELLGSPDEEVVSSAESKAPMMAKPEEYDSDMPSAGLTKGIDVTVKRKKALNMATVLMGKNEK